MFTQQMWKIGKSDFKCQALKGFWNGDWVPYFNNGVGLNKTIFEMKYYCENLFHPRELAALDFFGQKNKTKNTVVPNPTAAGYQKMLSQWCTPASLVCKSTI